jgi:hypothetical protein
MNEGTGIMIPKECVIDRCDERVRGLPKYHLPYPDTYTGGMHERGTAPTPPADALGAVVR